MALPIKKKGQKGVAPTPSRVAKISRKPETSWGGEAAWYDTMLETGADTYQSKVLLPNLLRIIAPRVGQTILDLACGQGFFSRAYADNGAKVVGVDIAPELIARAREQSKPNIVYHVGNAEKIPFIKNETIDVVSITLAIQNIENAKAVFLECFRVLKKGGRLVLVLNHPAFRVPKGSDWQFDENDATQYRRIAQYLSESKVKIDMHPGEQKQKSFTVSFHRPLQYFFKLFASAGFVVTRLEEWNSHKTSGNGPRKVAEDTARKEIPMFLMLEVKKQ